MGLGGNQTAGRQCHVLPGRFRPRDVKIRPGNDVSGAYISISVDQLHQSDAFWQQSQSVINPPMVPVDTMQVVILQLLA